MDKLANFFNIDIDFAMCLGNLIPEEHLIVNDIFKRNADSLDFNVYMQRKVAVDYQGVFSDEQLKCIFHAYHGIWINYHGQTDIPCKSRLFDFIENEGQGLYELVDVAAFMEKIDSMNSHEFEIFVNLIVEIWGMEDDMTDSMHEFFLNDETSKKSES